MQFAQEDPEGAELAAKAETIRHCWGIGRPYPGRLVAKPHETQIDKLIDAIETRQQNPGNGTLLSDLLIWEIRVRLTGYLAGLR